MKTMTATEARNNIGQLWDATSHGPVTVMSAGKRIAVVLSPDEFDKMAAARPTAKFGFAKELLAGVDIDALLATSIEDTFEGYL